MTRLLSALVLIPVVVGTIWFLPPLATLGLAEIAALLAFVEYVALARALGAHVPGVVAGAAVLAACASVVLPGATADVVLMSGLIAIGALAIGSGVPGPAVLRDVAASLLPSLYIGLPLGALAGVRAAGGRGAMLLLIVVVIVSDSAQYYTGRLLGRHPLAPAISPKKTREGAMGGLVFGTLAMMAGGVRVFPSTPVGRLILVGLTVTALGIVGDLFESLLKRSAGVKDSSNLIPGHGGILDRLDSWLFAGPVYYAFVRYLQ